jgi:bifunctional DNA-binding transcriptional regulator/antitoxin component of YhaV-PrlF toxin-antitoxin module
MPSVSLRKVIRFGKNGLVVTVPRGWARYYGLKGGEQLLVVVDGEITISPFNGPNESKAGNE